MSQWREGLRQLRRYPAAVAGLAIIALLVAVSIYTVIAIPYGQALDLWRGGDTWRLHPVNASPVWLDRLTGGNLPPTIMVSSRDAEREEISSGGVRLVSIPLEFDYRYDAFPSEINLFMSASFEELRPLVRLTWHTPDGREFPLQNLRIAREERVSISQSLALERQLGRCPRSGCWRRRRRGSRRRGAGGGRAGAVPADGRCGAVRGGRSVEADLVVYGRVHGLAGTDHRRRDLMVALLWGMPVALAFGLLAAVGTTVTTLVVAATGVWFGGWVDALIQRLTEVNMILPLLPILVMVGTLYSTSIWMMLGVVIALGIFSAGIKMYRAMLLPIRAAPYIEAARAYGAGNARIILRYMIPRILPVLIPTFVTLIPTFVFLEASLALLGWAIPSCRPGARSSTMRKAQSALYHGYYYWVVAPAIMLMLTGLGFAMLGFALDRVFNPRLRAI
jgi:peptide/nickel transport system permease protein